MSTSFYKTVDISIPRGTLVGNIEKSAHNEHIMIQEQIFDPGKLEEKLIAKNKPLPKRMSAKEENDYFKQAKIQVSPE
jgi:hypothetical protein